VLNLSSGISWLSPQKDTLINGPDVTCGLGVKANDKPATMANNSVASNQQDKYKTQDTDNEMKLQLLNPEEGAAALL